MANAPKSLLEQVAFMGRIVKNAGVSAKEAASAFQHLSEALSTVQTFSPDLWSKKSLNQMTQDDFIFEYMQQPVIDNASTHAVKSNDDVLTIDAIKKAVRKLEEIGVETRGDPMTEEQALYYPLPNRCPACCRQSEWKAIDFGQRTKCLRCLEEFSTDWLASGNGDYINLRTTWLELQSRQVEVDRMISQVERESLRTRERASYLMTKSGDLTESEREELNQILSSMGDVPSTGRDGSFARAPVSSRPLRRLSGQGITGDARLEGYEEAMILTDEPEERIEVIIPNTRERYFAKKKKHKPVEPLKPLKRKLDI